MLRNRVHLHHIGVDLCHLHGIAYQHVEPRCLLVHDRRQVQPSRFVEPAVFKQRCGRGSNRGQRRAQFMR
jgi:hypothetical protein